MSDAELDKSLTDALQVVSVLLVFLSVLFGMTFQRTGVALSEREPGPEQPKDRRSFRQMLSRSIRDVAVAVGFPSLLLALLLGPDAVRIVARSRFAYPNFDLVPTLFFVVELFVVAVVVWCLVVSLQLASRIRRAR